jgi:hypothetical protein
MQDCNVSVLSKKGALDFSRGRVKINHLGSFYIIYIYKIFAHSKPAAVVYFKGLHNIYRFSKYIFF